MQISQEKKNAAKRQRHCKQKILRNRNGYIRTILLNLMFKYRKNTNKKTKTPKNATGNFGGSFGILSNAPL